MPETLARGEDKPPSRRMKRYWKVAVLANIKDDTHPKPEGVPPDAFADFDHIETIDSLRAALETDGHETVFIQADMDLPYALKEVKPDICFNIAEGLGGVESLVGHPRTMSHSRVPDESKDAHGLVENLVRLSVGIEHVDDLIADLRQALV